MKKQTKRVLGLCGLVLVGVMTALACLIPGANTNATSSVTDTIKVRVVPSHPDVVLSGVTNGQLVTSASQSFKVDYFGMLTFQVSLTFTDQNGNTHTKTFPEEFVDYAEGQKEYPVNLNEIVGDDGYPFGYGPYVISVMGVGHEGVTDTDALSFEYLPVYAEVSKDEESDDSYLDVHYDEENVDKIKINVYQNGNLVFQIDPESYPVGRIKLPFDEHGLDEGLYTVELIAYDREGKQLYKPFVLKVKYEPEFIATPDTGSVMQNLNISKTDYLITGILIFTAVVIIGVTLILRSGKNTRNRR